MVHTNLRTPEPPAPQNLTTNPKHLDTYPVQLGGLPLERRAGRDLPGLRVDLEELRRRVVADESVLHRAEVVLPTHQESQHRKLRLRLKPIMGQLEIKRN